MPTARLAGTTYPGRSVRFVPTEEYSQQRAANRDYLKQAFTADPSPTATMIAALQERENRYGKPLGAIPKGSSEARYIMQALNPKEAPLPIGSDSPYEWLKQRAESGRIGPVYRDVQANVPVALTTYDSPTQRGMYRMDLGDGEFLPSITLREGLPPMDRAAVLAHEMGHHMMGHGFGERPTGIKEVEAETVAYAVMNRLYPHSNFIDRSSRYIHGNQLGLEESLIEHLQNPEVAERINTATKRIIPGQRKEFRNVLPSLYA